MATPLKLKAEQSQSSSIAGEDEELREVHFYASLALCIAVPENYAAIMASMPSYHPTHTYRLSYKLFPTEENTDIDVALFGAMAKLYCKDQTLCVKVFEERTHVWIAWSKQHIVKVTDDVLLNTFDHVCNVYVLGAAEKIKSDRPKGFRVTDAFYESIQFLRTFSQWTLDTPSLETSESMLTEFPPDTWEKLSRISVKSVDINAVPPWQELEEIRISVPTASTGTGSSSGSDYSADSPFPSREHLYPLVMCGLQPVTGINYRLLNDWLISKERSMTDSEYWHAMDDFPPRSNAPVTLPYKPIKTTNLVSSLELRKRMTQVTVAPLLQMKMQTFIAGLTSQVVRMDPIHNPSTLSDAVFLVSTEDELLSEKQKAALNPLSVKIWHVEDLPPLEKNGEDEPSAKTVYVQYKMLNQKSRRTKLRHHNTKKVVWNDNNVFLLGTMPHAKIREFFSGPPLTIEVHDRDNGVTLKNMKSSKPSLFGHDPLDNLMSSSVFTAHNMLFDTQLDLNHPLNTFGVAQLDLSGFLAGRTKIEYCEQVMCSLEQKRRQSVAQKYVRETFNPEDIYLEAGTSLEVSISLRVPLANPIVDPTQQKALLPRGSFARIVIQFSSSQKAFLYKLMRTIIDINTAEFVKNDLPTTYCIGLSIPLLPMIDRLKNTMDIMTGVHIFDQHFHIFYLEGLALGSMQNLWKCLSCLGPGYDSQIKILYNSAMVFGERLYLLLPAFVCHLRFYTSLRKLLHNLHQCKFESSNLQDQCLKGLQCVDQLSLCSSLGEVVKHSLFPSVNMILSMSQHVGHMTTTDQITNLLGPPQPLPYRSMVLPKKTKIGKRRLKPILPNLKIV